jgi:Family of unknown function (DUF6082)
MRTRRQGFLWGRSEGLSESITHRLAVSISLLLVGLATFGMVLLSPVLLREIDRLINADWSRLSEIGQTYGAASAILAMLALGGVALSLLFQARQSRAQRVQAARHYHFELYRMTLENPELYLPLWDAPDLPPTREGQRYGFTNLIFNYAWMSYELRVVSEPDLRRFFAGILRGPVGSSYWSRARDSWPRYALGRRGRAFVQIIDDEYRRAIAEKDPINHNHAGSDSPSIQNCDHHWVISIGMLVTFASGVLCGVVLRRKRKQ